jgi:hypothetical protein
VVGDGLGETVTLRNLGREPSAVTMVLHVDADFMDLFAVKGGHGSHGGGEATVVGIELLLRDRSDGSRGVSVSASADPLVLPGTLGGFKWSMRQCITRLDLGPSRGLPSGLIRDRWYLPDSRTSVRVLAPGQAG